MYAAIKQSWSAPDVSLVRLYRDVQSPAPGVLFATKDLSSQETLHSRLKVYMADTYPETTFEIKKFGASDKLKMIARGVPLEADLGQLVNQNLGHIQTDSIERLQIRREGKHIDIDTIVFHATNETSAEILMKRGLKCGHLIVDDVSIKIKPPLVCFICGLLGHSASRCSSSKARELVLDDTGKRPVFCFKCGTPGHRYYECPSPGPTRCPNCPIDATPHWPFDRACPARQKKLSEKAKSVNKVWSNVLTSSNSKQTQNLERRVQTLESKALVLHKNYETQKDAIHSTRMVLRDVSRVATKEKTKLSAASKTHIASWYQWEKQLQLRLAEQKLSPPTSLDVDESGGRSLRRSKRRKQRATVIVSSDDDSEMDHEDAHSG